MNAEIDATLNERGKRYGAFCDNSHASQIIKAAFRAGKNYRTLSHVHHETLDQLAGKLGRMLSGDPWYEDNIIDAMGFLQLLLNHVREKEGKLKQCPLVATGNKPFQQHVTDWQDVTFPDANATSYLKKLVQEIDELKSSTFVGIHVGEELADVQIVLWGLANKLGINLDAAVEDKHRINQQRKWERMKDGTYQHVEEVDA